MQRTLGDDDNRVLIKNSNADTDEMSDDSEIEDKRRKKKMSSKRSKGKGKRSLSTGNEKGAKRRCLETESKKETTKTRGKPYSCQFCETAFNNVSSRNGHYSGKHKVHDEKLLFFPNGTGLVESSLEHQISLKPDWFKAAVRSKRRTTVCKLCEVDLDTEDHLNLHYKDIHKVTRTSVLSELIRLKNTDIKKVAVTHKCSSCPASFDDAQELEMHMKSAHDADFKRCDYCNIRVQIDVYNVHIQKKHADMIDKRVEIRSVVEVPEPKPKQAKREKKVKAVKKVETPKREVNKDKVKKTKDQKVADWCSKLVPANKKTALTLYLCKTCKLATASYDNAVSHAQDHILNLRTVTNHCEICKLNFAADFNIHKKLHLTNEDLDADSFRLFPYDYRLLMSHKWFDMFVNSSKTMANKVRSASIYFPSRCIRLKIEKESKDPSERFTLFMCVTCNKYVDPPSIELHVEQQGDCSNQLSCYLCYRCQRQFFSQKARDQHISTHEIPDASKRYRTVLFNDRNDLICNRKLLQAGMNIVVTNNERVNNNATENSESIVETDIIAVVNEALYKDENVEKIENDVFNELYPTVTDSDVVADIYECKCGLSFDRLEFLCKHWKICSPTLKLETKACKCGLVFDKQNYDYHCTVHSNGITTFTVNEISIRVKNSIDVSHIKDEFINTTELNISEIIYNGLEEDNVREEDVNKDTQGRILQNLQVVNIANVKEVVANNLLNERQTLSNRVHQPVNIENYQQSSNEHGSAEYIVKTEDDSKTVYEQFESYKLLISNDISNNISQTELKNQVAMDVTDTSISVQNYDVPDNTNVCSSNADENQSMVDTTVEIDLQQVTFQDKNLLIYTKEQDCVENSNPEKDLVSPSLEENKLSDSTLSHVKVLHNANSVNTVIGVVEDILDKAEINTHDEATPNTEGDKADVQFVDNKNTENYQRTSNEHDNTEFIGKTQAISQTVDKEFEAHKVLVSNDISNSVSQTELENQVVMDVTDASIRIQNDDLPDNKKICNNNADENQSVVDISMEIDLQQGTYQGENLLISNTKEQGSAENSEPGKDPVNPSLRENEVSDSVMKEIPHENVIHNTNSVNENSDVVEDKLDEGVINTLASKLDTKFVDNRNKNTDNYQQTSNEHDNAEYIGKTQANSQTVDKEFEAHEVLILNDVGNVSQTELEHQIAMDVTDASIRIQNEGVPDNGNVCNNNVDEKQSMVNTSMEIDVQQGTYQDENLLISNTKEQDSVKNSELEKDTVSPSLQENKLNESFMKEIPHENDIQNTNSVNEDSDVVEDKPFKTEIREESYINDEAGINTQGAKADIEFVDNQNKNAEIYQKTSNEHDDTEFISKTQVNTPTVDKEFEDDKVLISNDISDNVTQIESENQLDMHVTEACICIQNDDVPDSKKICNNNADEKQAMVDTSMAIDLQQEICQDKNLLISNTKEQDRVENSKPETDPVGPSLEENKLHENVLPNANSVNEISGVVEDILDNARINTHDKATTNTEGDKADVQFVDNQNSNTGNYQQTSNEHDNTEFIGKSQANSQAVDKEFEADKVFSQTELENQVAMDVTYASISVQNDDVPDSKKLCNNNADENQSMFDSSMEIDLQQGTCQDKNLLISNTKEQDRVESTKPETDAVGPSLEENKLNENVLPNANSVNEISGVVEYILDNVEINTHDEATAITEEDKTDVQFVDNQNSNTGNYQQTSNEHENIEFIGKSQANSQTVDKGFETDKVLISNDIGNNVSQTELENQVAMDVTDASMSVQNDYLPVNTNLSSNNADENQYMVDTSMEKDLQQGTCQDKNLLISNTKEQVRVENTKLETDPVGPSSEENKLHENVLPNVNSVNEISGVVEDILDNAEINTHDEATTNTEGYKVDVQFVDNQNSNTGNYQQTSNEHDNTEFISKSQANSQTVDKEFKAAKDYVADKVFSQTELENQVAMDVTDASISVQNDDVPDNTNLCSNTADENPYMVDTSMKIDSQKGTYQDKNLLISNTKEQDRSEPEKDPVIQSLEENKLSDSFMKEIPHENVLLNANSVNEVSDVDETLEETNTRDEAVINTQELWAKEADVVFVDSENKYTERNDIKSNDHPKDVENEREHIRTETEYTYNNQSTEMVYSEEELLDGPEDPGAVDDSILTDDEDL